uniref:NS5 protein n=2 Tax=unclassified Flaviviridae TaxID=38144 RepID=A0A7S9KIU7_9FLAV|nr:NS5 protein [Jingmen tick virus]QPN36941.1 polyprotein [Solling flavi-like virus]
MEDWLYIVALYSVLFLAILPMRWGTSFWRLYFEYAIMLILQHVYFIIVFVVGAHKRGYFKCFNSFYGAMKISYHGSFEKLKGSYDRVVWAELMGLQSKKTLRTGMGHAFKKKLNNMKDNEFHKIRMYGVAEETRGPGVLSRAEYKLVDILTYMRKKMGGQTVVDLCAGRGGWTNVALRYGCRSVHAVSFWSKQPSHEQRTGNIWSDRRVTFSEGDYRNQELMKTNWVLFDGGESNQNADAEKNGFLKLMNNDHTHGKFSVTDWLLMNPGCNYAIKIMTPWDEETIKLCEHWQEITGRGTFVRLNRERISNACVYFISDNKTNLRHQANELMATLMFKIDEAKGKSIKELKAGAGIEQIKAEWPKKGNYKCPVKLEPYDMSASVSEFGELKPPRNITRFMKEIGWRYSTYTGSPGTYPNRYVMTIIGVLREVMSSFGNWKSTDTTPESTFEVVSRKIDVAPTEEHKHWVRIGEAYKGIAEHLRGRQIRMKRLDLTQVPATINNQGAMGHQEKFKPYSTLGEYVNTPNSGWAQEVNKFGESLNTKSPKMLVYNSMGKKERKQMFGRKPSGSRLIWFLPGTARLYEALIFADLDRVVKKLHVSVSGIPLYDYGEALYDCMERGKKDRVFVCDDVPGWDTKVGLGWMCHECHFLKMISDGDKYHKEIENLYRIYAYPTVNIHRMINGKNEEAIYQLQGQVSSGRRVTYAMNTITNTVVTLCRVAYALGVKEEDMRQWVKDKLKRRSDEYGGKISGDDSALCLSEKVAQKVVRGAGIEFMNDIGFGRKNRKPDEPSEIIREMKSVEFCSHRYTLVKYMRKRDKATKMRWMPIRSVEEILAKATIMTSKPVATAGVKEKYIEAAWARAQAMNLLVNYHHLSEARTVALALLTATPTLQLEGMSKGARLIEEPWLRKGRVIDIINNCLFGESTTYSEMFEGFSLDFVHELGYISECERAIYGVKTGTAKRKKWVRRLFATALRVRSEIGINQENEYHEWICEMKVFNDQYKREGRNLDRIIQQFDEREMFVPKNERYEPDF